MIDKVSYNPGLGDEILKHLKDAPDADLSKRVRDAVNSFITANPTTKQTWRFLVQLSKEPPTEISSFVRVLCDLERFYIEPS